MSLGVDESSGQGGDAESPSRDLGAQVLEAEAAHFQKTNSSTAKAAEKIASSKREQEDDRGSGGEEDVGGKRRGILEEARGGDADSDSSKSESSDDDSDDKEDEIANCTSEEHDELDQPCSRSRQCLQIVASKLWPPVAT